jgi:hypothetical protein
MQIEVGIPWWSVVSLITPESTIRKTVLSGCNSIQTTPNATPSHFTFLILLLILLSSKKDPEVRRKELLSYVLKPLTAYITTHIKTLLKVKHGCDLIYETINALEGTLL